jgi:MYXO-CTERM domain-containing protein
MTKIPTVSVLRHILHSSAALAILTLTTRASAAPQLVFYQDWEEVDAFTKTSWMTTPGCGWFSPDDNSAPAVESKTPAPGDCTGTYETETILSSGGRAFSKNAVPVAANDRLCVTAWIRTNGQGAPPARAQPFLGINFTTSATGLVTEGSVGGCRNREHWLLGDGDAYDPEVGANGTTCTATDDDYCCSGRSIAPYGNTTLVGGENDNLWHFYSKTFTVDASDVSDKNSWLVLKLQNGTGGQCDDPPVLDARAGADFDDIRIYKLAAGDVCPTQANVIAGGDDAHATCAGNTAFCNGKTVDVTVSGVVRKVTQRYCGGCATSYGDVGDAACSAGAKPACDRGTHTCEACNGDFNSGATRSCGAAEPLCKPDHTCGKCTSDQDCSDVAGITHGGASCVADACSGTCTIGADGTSPECGANRYCVAGDGGGCKAKQPNGDPIPSRAEDGAASGTCVLPGEAGQAHITATIFCASGTCSKADNLCGLPNGESCTVAGACRSGVCGADNKCGVAQGGACTKSAECRGELTCEGGACGGKPAQCTVDANCGAANFVCEKGTCVGGCRGTGGNGCSDGRPCSSTDATVGQCGEANQPDAGGVPGPVDGNDAGTTENDKAPAADAGGCSTANATAGSLSPMLVGLTALFGAIRRRRRSTR